MSDNLLSTWRFSATSSTEAIVLPDGCRDLIMEVVDGKPAQWFVSPLFDQSKTITIEANSTLCGFRLHPGTRISEKALLTSIQDDISDFDAISNQLEDFTTRTDTLDEALSCLASNVESINQAAKKLGVSTRTLQRLISSETARSPTYWIQLARARRAARALLSTTPLVDISEIHGYADQPHMSREFKRWFGISPSVMRNTPSLLHQCYNLGYD